MDQGDQETKNIAIQEKDNETTADVKDKRLEAKDIMRKCKVEGKGFVASNDRYTNQMYSRDLCISVFHYMEEREKKLSKLQKLHISKLRAQNQEDRSLLPYENTSFQMELESDERACVSHFQQIMNAQGSDGSIPIIILVNEEAFKKKKLEQFEKTGRKSFILSRFLEGKLHQLTPHTRDSEVLYVRTVYTFLELFVVEKELEYRLKDSANRALHYVWDSLLVPLDKFIATKSLSSDPTFKIHSLVSTQSSTSSSLSQVAINKSDKSDTKDTNDLGMWLIRGADWRDTRDDLDLKCVLLNACHLYAAFATHEAFLAHKMEYNNYVVWKGDSAIISKIPPNQSMVIKNIIQEKFWSEEKGYFIDYIGNDNFDVIGNAFVILYGITTSDKQVESIFKHVEKHLSTDYGIKMIEVFLPALSTEEAEIMNRDKAVIWPFVSGFMLEAMAIYKDGNSPWFAIAKQKYEKWKLLSGFYEWYAISTGKGYGSKDQIWSAAQFLRLALIFEECNTEYPYIEQSPMF